MSCCSCCCFCCNPCCYFFERTYERHCVSQPSGPKEDDDDSDTGAQTNPFNCTQCYRPYSMLSRDPRVLRCGHSVCKGCLSPGQLTNLKSARCAVCGTRSPHPWPRNYALQTMVMQRDSQQTLEDEIGRVANAVGGSSGNADPLRQVRSMRSEVEGSSSSSSRKERFNAEEFKQRSSSSFQHNAQPNHSHTPTASAALRQSFQNSKRQSQSFSGDPGERGDPDGGGRGGGTDAAVVAGMLFNEQHARGGGSSSSSKAALLSPYSSLQSETARGQSDAPSPSSPKEEEGGEGSHLSETGGGYVALPTLEKAGLGAFIPALQEQKYRKQQAERGSGGKLNEKSLSRSLSSSGEEYLTLGDLSPVFISDLSLAQVGMTPLQIRKLRFAVNSDLSSGSGDDDGGGGGGGGDGRPSRQPSLAPTSTIDRLRPKNSQEEASTTETKMGNASLGILVALAAFLGTFALLQLGQCALSRFQRTCIFFEELDSEEDEEDDEGDEAYGKEGSDRNSSSEEEEEYNKSRENLTDDRQQRQQQQQRQTVKQEVELTSSQQIGARQAAAPSEKRGGGGNDLEGGGTDLSNSNFV
mmetsp:Transcript_29955/g.54319  ORF Transcript_29955/g.54319 Transcript_29955/m.54319 type:complete len:581 (-) Transcript_29955:136-1878(-)